MGRRVAFANAARPDDAWKRVREWWPATLPPLDDVLKQFVDGGAAFEHLLAVSPVSAEKLARDPEALSWLARPEIHSTTRGPRRMRGHYIEHQGEGFDPAFQALRRVKSREMLRIALRDVAGWSDLEATTLELAALAELCLDVVYHGWLTELRRRWGEPQADFAVLGMGKLGGQELNYSSDIDVLFIYSEEGRIHSRLTYEEFFTRLAEKITATFSAPDPAGTLFRIDLRLRPEGAAGPLVRSIDSLENYYAGFGETWERMALIKARVVAGSAELGYEFGHRFQPFIFPRAVSLEVLDEIRTMKDRIEKEIVGSGHLRRNIKLGWGGIREIEFVVQTLQMLHGARNAFLQERNTLKALRALQEIEMIPVEEMRALTDAYRFLRTVEHRLQIENEAQIHVLPENPEALRKLAASLAWSFENGAPAERARQPTQDPLGWFEALLARHTGAVRSIFEKVLHASSGVPPKQRHERNLSFFQDPVRAMRVLSELENGPRTVVVAPRTRKLYARLEPMLLEHLEQVADPDVALTRFVRFVERYGLRGLLFETLLRNPRVAELLIRLLDASHFMTEVVLKRPQLIEEIARGHGLGQAFDVPQYLQGLEKPHENLPWSEWLRVYRRSQALRIGLRDLLRFTDGVGLQAEYSALAEACLVFAQRQLGLEQELTVIAMGKFGGRELGYGADLDVVFMGENQKGAGELIRTMNSVTSEGNVFPLDTRLRPEGDAGLLAISLPGYEAYFQRRAQMWEAQALTKARPVSGPQQPEALATIRRIWRQFGTREDAWDQIAEMYARIVRDRAAGNELDFKAGAGGLMQVEFFVQACQMRSGVWEQNTLAALQALAHAGVVSGETSQRLSRAYSFLRRVESVLRCEEDTNVVVLPTDPAAQCRVARRCAFETRDEFLRACAFARQEIRTVASFRRS